MLHQPFSRLAGLLILALLLSACGGPAAPVENTPSLPASAPQPSATPAPAVEAGSALRVKGFLARRYRTGITLALHINEFELSKGN